MVKYDYILPNREYYITEGRYPINSIFYEDSSKKYQLIDKGVVFYGTDTLIFGSIDREVVLLCDESSCPEGYEEYSLDVDRLLVTGNYKDTYGTINISESINHNHLMSVKSNLSSGGSWASSILQSDTTVTSFDGLLLSEYIKLKICVFMPKYFGKLRGYYE